MNCPACGKEVSPDRIFCIWCDTFVPNPSVGRRAGLVRRWFANLIDPAIALLLWFIIAWILTTAISMPSGSVGPTGGIMSGVSPVIILIAIIIYLILFIWWIRRGITPGKWLLRMRVVNKLNGQIPGFWRMVLREVIGKTVSGAFLGLGFFWAIWDTDNQAWHDKIAGTVVVRAGGKLQQSPLQPQTEPSSRETPSISAESEQGQPERIASQAQPSQAPTPARVPYKATTRLKPRRHWGRWLFLFLLLAIGVFVSFPIISGYTELPQGLDPQAISKFLVGMWDYWVQIVSGLR